MTGINRSVVMAWEPSSYSGWGIYGVNLMLNWSRQQKHPLLCNMSLNESLIDLNPIEWGVFRQALESSREFQARLDSFRGQEIAINFPVLDGLGNDLRGAVGAHDVKISGSPSIGVTFSESTSFSPEGRERAKAYSLVVAGSNWNQTVIEYAGIGPTALVLQGVDTTAFHPAPRAGWFGDRFAIFSGGKLEYRKGQDLVLRAFRVFADRHPEAVLVTAWGSPWPAAARSLSGVPNLAPVAFRPDGKLDLPTWVAANGIAPSQVIDLGIVPNSAMPKLYREMDVGLFPNRCEGGTNLVAMECMACGVPVILSRNTGHLDLIASERCFPLERQAEIDGPDHLGWGESDVDEIVATLEIVRQNHSESLVRATRGAAFMRTMSWADTARRLATVIEPYI